MTIIPDGANAESTSPNLATYVINLPTSTQRREKMEMQLSVMKLPYEIFTAVNGMLSGQVCVRLSTP
jgi:GR25 family glycosyltransferase involved in LPS biosynthesis